MAEFQYLLIAVKKLPCKGLSCSTLGKTFIKETPHCESVDCDLRISMRYFLSFFIFEYDFGYVQTETHAEFIPWFRYRF